jgi:hypothetical protein
VSGNPYRAAALYYASIGWWVFQLAPGSKEPLAGSHGLLQATTDPERIREWWRTIPNANIGIATGPSGLCVADTDPRHGGDESWADLARQHGAPETLTALTPGGGQHYYYARGEAIARNTESVLGPGIDTRGFGGYVVAPPSRRPDGEYRWEILLGPRDGGKLAPLPPWIAEALTTHSNKALDLSEDTSIIEGGRNTYLARVAGKFRRDGLGVYELNAMLQAMNKQRCRPALPEAEVENIAKSIGCRPAANAGFTKPQRADAVFEERSLSEAFAGSHVEHLVEGLIPYGGSLLLSAKKKVGKSVFFVNLAKAIATGGEFLGRRCRQGGVVYISLDEARAITQERFEAIGAMDLENIWFVYERHSPENWPQYVRAICERRRPAILLIDTLAKLARIREVNSYGEWNAAFSPLYSIADELNCAFAVSAHNKKNGKVDTDATVGSTAQGGGVDSIVILAKDSDKTRTIFTEQRHGRDMEPTILTLDPDTFALSIGEEKWLAKQRELEARLYHLIPDEGASLDRLCELVSARRLHVSRALSASIDSSWIEREGSGMRANPWVFKRSNSGNGKPKSTVNIGSIPFPEPTPLEGGMAGTAFGDDAEWTVQVGETQPEPHGTPGIEGMAGTPGMAGTESEDPDLLERYAEEKGLW